MIWKQLLEYEAKEDIYSLRTDELLPKLACHKEKRTSTPNVDSEVSALQ